MQYLNTIYKLVKMGNFYRNIEIVFEKLSMFITKVLGNSITFILALILIAVYFSDEQVYHQPRHRIIMDVIFSTTFLSLFIIQKTMNHFSKALHIKMNELVASNENASNRLINVEGRSEQELHELAKKFSDLAEQAQSSTEMQGAHSIEKVMDDTDENGAPIKTTEKAM